MKKKKGKKEILRIFDKRREKKMYNNIIKLLKL